MMEPMEKSEGVVLDKDSPPSTIPPPPPTSAPPLDDSPPPKPKKVNRRTVSPARIENGKANNDEEEGEEGLLNTSYGSGGVARIVDEIEKYNSLGERSRNAAASPSRLEELTKFEQSVLRELPVDVDVENEDLQNKKNARKKRSGGRRGDEENGRRGDEENGGFSSGGEESPRKSRSTVRRTPTMEFMKQCSKIGRIRTKV
ncbi:hypothetical protein FHG87_025579, partial [Trinorchestia longiramus]